MSLDRIKALLKVVLSPTLWFDVYWPATRKYWFSLLFIGVICAKLLHIYSHLNSLTIDRLLLWGPTFFLLDIIYILIAQNLCRNLPRRWLRVLATPTVILLSLFTSGLAAANISFYFQTGAEIHWRQAHHFHRDAASVKTLLTGLSGMVLGEAIFSAVAWITTPYLYNFVREGGRSLAAAVAPLWKRVKPKSKEYDEVPFEEWDDDEGLESEEILGTHIPIGEWDEERDSPESGAMLESRIPTRRERAQRRPPLSRTVRIVVPVLAIFVLLLRCIRPSETSYAFLSQTVVLTPFEKPPKRVQSWAVDVPDMPGNYSWLYDHTALAPPPQFDWLPKKEVPGFRDWYQKDSDKALHYDPAKDPLHISNLDRDIIEPLRATLKDGNVSIKHVLLLKLESFRSDIFPLRNESHIGEVIRNSYPNNKIPADVAKRLAGLTRNAERLAGTPSGFDTYADNFTARGGLDMTNAYTGDTFTLKSILASACGIAPLVIDFNREFKHHIYEPCMPQVLNALNNMPSVPEKDPNDYTTWPWFSTFMQSITDNYDNQDRLLPAIGFYDKVTDENITKAWEKKPGKGPEKYNFWGYPEIELRDYFLKALQNAEEKQERLFLMHLTGQSHHPWDMPPGDKYEELMHSSVFSHKVNRYLNTVGVTDRWLGEVMDVLDEAGVANETLVVLVGDHGISHVEDGAVTPYDNPQVSNFHVPLVFSHPQLPPIKVDGRVTSMQIVPTILDLLVESGSFDKERKHAIEDLLPLYEGQSMIRDLVPEKDGQLDWQFTVMNTGGTWLAMRSAPKPYRLIVPLLPEVPWRFTDVDLDPQEEHKLESFTLLPLLEQVNATHGEDAAQWIRDAAHVAQWWVAENWARYEYTPER